MEYSSHTEEVANQAAEANEQRLRELADAMPQIVWTAGADGSVDYFNRRWFDYTGMTLEESRGWGWQHVLHPDDLAECLVRWTKAVESGEEYEVECRFRRASDGNYRWHIGRATPVRDHDGRIVKWYGTNTDIHEQKQLEAAIDQARIELERRVEARTADLSTANLFLREQIAERQRAEEVLRQSRQLYKYLVEYATDLIYRTDAHGRFIFLNPPAAHLLESLTGNSAETIALDIVAPSHRAAARELYTRQLIERIPNTYFEFPSITKDRRERWIEQNVQIVIEDERVTGYQATARDITERKMMEAELENARDVALDHSRLKSEFLANMSHEIRTPMNGVIGMTTILLGTQLTPEQRDFTQTIQTSAEALLDIINDILDFSKIEAGKMRFDVTDFDLHHTMETAVGMHAERAAAKGLELASLVERDVPVALRGDPGRLRQVLTNLIGNALKFTERGEIIVSVSVEDETPTHTRLRFTIKDTGIGIPAQALHHLFQPFTQADGSMTRRYGGTGLGLAISKQFVELMGGEIGVESVIGGGSTFWFTAALEKGRETTAGAWDVRGDVRGLRVLVVDDNTTSRNILLQQTRAWGMTPTEARSGTQALQCLRRAMFESTPFDLAILDLQMPDMDGVELARAINNENLCGNMRLVLLTSFGWRGQAQLARETGIHGYLVKPVRQSQLFDLLATVMADVEQPDASESARAASKLVTRHTLVEARQPIDAETDVSARTNMLLSSPRRVLVAEDNPTNRRVAEQYLKALGYDVYTVSDGRQALAALAETPYEIVLMDCQMSVMDGFEATAEIRLREQQSNAPQRRRTPIIAMTANAMQGDRERCIAAGMDDYLTKPVKLDNLRDTLARWHESVASNDAGASLADSRILTAEDISAVDRVPIDYAIIDSLRKLQAADKPSLIVELLELYVSDTLSRLVTLRDAVERADIETIRNVTHSLKGSSASLGALRIADLSEAVERLYELPQGEAATAETRNLLDELDDAAINIKHLLEEERNREAGETICLSDKVGAGDASGT